MTQLLAGGDTPPQVPPAQQPPFEGHSPSTPSPKGRRRAPHQARRRQWGHDRRTQPLPVVPPPISERRVGLARLSILFTVVAWFIYLVMWVFQDLLNPSQRTAVSHAEAVVYLLVVSVLTASTLAYLLSRLGFFYRARSHHRATRLMLDEFFQRATPTLTALVPSYQEDARVVRNTLLSVALQEYPDIRVVLLVDDPPKTRDRRAASSCTRRGRSRERSKNFFRGLPRISAKFWGRSRTCPRAPASSGRRAWCNWRRSTSSPPPGWTTWPPGRTWLTIRRLHGQPRPAQAGAGSGDGGRRHCARRLRNVRSSPGNTCCHMYRRLAWTFEARLSFFERKRYVSLSHEPNKAMNLNSYIGLMGGHYRESATASGPALVPAAPPEASLSVPEPDYVLTLDADSVLFAGVLPPPGPHPRAAGTPP